MSHPSRVICRVSPILSGIFTQSIESGEVPDDGTQALVTPIFEKGNRHLAENYRPVSLTSVPCKILEHIICSYVRDHLDRHNILSTLQHGFRERHSCESQLLTTLQDLLSLHDRGIQVDLVVLAPVPLTIFRSNSKFDQNLLCSGLKCTLPITTEFCTRHDSVTVVTCAKFRCDRLSIVETRALPILIEFRIRSKYR